MDCLVGSQIAAEDLESSENLQFEWFWVDFLTVGELDLCAPWQEKAFQKRAMYRRALRLHAPKRVEKDVLLYINERP